MPPTLPSSVQETLGDPAADDFARWLETYVEERAVMRDEYREVLSRLDQIDERFERVEGRIDETNERLDRMEGRFEKRFDQIDQRLNEQSAQLNQRLGEQSRQFNQRLDGVNERIDHEQMRVQTRWTVGTIALFGTIVTVLLAIAEFSA